MLYVLQGDTVTRDTILASRSLSDDGITKLLPMRLRHMGENNIEELSRR